MDTPKKEPEGKDHQEDLKGEKKCRSAFSSVENSPLMDRDSLLRYSASSRDEFWDALSSNYDYLMDDGLINTCREASSDLSVDDDSEISESTCWSFKQFIEQFKCLHDILHNIQVAKDDGSRKSDGEILEEQQNVAYLCKLFNEQAQKLSKRYPEMRDEVHRRLNLLNNKWKAVEQSINPNSVKSPSKDNIFDEITYRMSSVRRWLRDLESRLCPEECSFSLSFEEAEEKYKIQMALQKEIEEKGKHVNGLLKLCEHIHGNVRFGQNPLMTWDAERVRKIAKNLEHKWHLIWIKSLEIICSLEVILVESSEGSEKLEKSFSEEPLKKYPRLGDNYERIALIENELKRNMNFKLDAIFLEKTVQNGDTILACESMPKNDKAVMVGDTGIAELKAECGDGKFEIIQDIGYSSETSAHLSTDEKLENSPPTNGMIHILNESRKQELYNLAVDRPKIYLPPDKYPSVSVKVLNSLSEERSCYKSKLNEPKSVPDRFYQVTCIDDEDVDELNANYESTKTFKSIENLNNEINSSDAPQKNINYENNVSRVSKSQKSSSEVQNSVKVSETAFENNISTVALPKKVKRSSRSSKPWNNGDIYRKTERVAEWLNNCQSADDGTSDDNQNSHEKPSKGNRSPKVINSSCDASGECTSNESGSEKSISSDVNNSITMSQSFTGSIETVIPAVAEDSGATQKTASYTTVKMRKKKRTRDRPWSVIEINKGSFAHSSVSHSTSEGALDLLYSSQESGKINFRSRKIKNKRFSLSDVSLLCGSFVKGMQKSCIDPNLTSSSSNKESKRKESVSDPNSDSCENASFGLDTTLIPSEKDSSMEEETLRTEENLQEDVLMNILPEISLSLETDIAGSAVNTEDQASISDQAWDEYQDPPYLSEPYSEQTADEDEVRKLINFGDDYRTVLGSYSDTSSVSLKVPPHKHHRSRTRSSNLLKSANGGSSKTLSSDTNSDTEDFNCILSTSRHAYQFVFNSIKDTHSKAKPSSNLTESIATCQTNLRHLNFIYKEFLNGNCELEASAKENLEELQELIKDWEELLAKVYALSRGEQKINNIDVETATLDINCSLSELKGQLNNLSDLAVKLPVTPLSLEQLKTNIISFQSGLSNVQELKEAVLSVSARILRLIAESGGQAPFSLKESATKLYQQWEDVYELHCTQLTKLQTLLSQWCEPTEKKIEEALETTVQWKPVQVGSNLPRAETKCEEPYQKAAAEVQIADELDVAFKIENQSPEGILQCFVAEKQGKEILHEPLKHTKVSATDNTKKLKTSSFTVKKSDNPKNSRKSLSCFWRCLMAALPVQVGLVILYCISLYLDPQCCENMNNYEFSLLPRLRYFQGPPPA